jgi:hypothetical protein
VVDKQGLEHGNRTVEIRDYEREFARTSRDMESLRQWARMSDGLALPAEECSDGEALMEHIRQRAEAAYRQRPVQKPAGINGGMLLVLLSLLAGEWLLRRRWDWK